MTDIIVDIETLGTKPGCPIIEIGACAADPGTGEIVAIMQRPRRQGTVKGGRA